MELSDSEEELILHDYDPEATAGSYFAPIDIDSTNLHVCVSNNNIEGVKELVGKGYELNLVDFRGYTVLHTAVVDNRLDIVKFLLKQPELRYDTQNHFGETPLFLSLKSQCSDETIFLLINNGCDINITNSENVSPLHLAVRRDTTIISHQLILRGANINVKDRDGYTPLHEAAITGKFDNVCMLLYYGALPDEKTYFSQATAFHMACSTDYRLETARYLLNYIVDLEDMDNDGLTALLIALKRKSDIALDLIKRGANLYVMEDTVPCIDFSLRYKTSTVFEAIWNQIDYKYIINLKYCILYNFLKYSDFPIDQFLKCLYMIFESPYIYDIIHKFTKQKFINIYSTIARYKEISLEERIKIYYLFLSYGIPIFFNDILELHIMNDFDESLEVILTSGCCIQPCEMHLGDLLVSRICYNNLNIVRLFMDNETKLKYCKFYAWNIEKEEILELFENYINLNHSVPSLLQLSRDVIRAIFFKIYSKPHICNVYKAIMSLELPKIIKDILILKQPIYDKPV